ncbi:MAG: hypothetical protein DRK00_06570 [Thermoprotei archaeon]|nr:MAG: hypothetical protein DRK00_06570 [Thermoprotei archaeon]
MSEVLDAVIVGAGPAGLSAAVKLAEEGFRVVVLEREARPNFEKLCAGYVPARVFEEFEIPTSLAECSIRGLKIVSDRGEWIVEFDDVVGYNVSRTRLAEYLAGRVRSRGGEVLTSTPASRIVDGEHYATIYSRRGELKARIVVAADGAYSKTGGEIRGGFKPEDLGLAIQVKTALKPGDLQLNLNVVMLGAEYSPFGYAWIFPKRSYLDAGLGALASRVRGSSLRGYLERLVEKFELEPLETARYAPVPLTGPLYNVARGRVLLVGDAAGHASPLTGEGIRFALLAGRIAAEAASLYLKNRIALREVYEAYVSKLKKSFYRRLRLDKLIVKVMERGKFASSRLLEDSGLRRMVAELYLDVKDTQYALLSSIPRLIRLLLR